MRDFLNLIGLKTVPYSRKLINYREEGLMVLIRNISLVGILSSIIYLIIGGFYSSDNMIYETICLILFSISLIVNRFRKIEIAKSLIIIVISIRTNFWNILYRI